MDKTINDVFYDDNQSLRAEGEALVNHYIDDAEDNVKPLHEEDIDLVEEQLKELDKYIDMKRKYNKDLPKLDKDYSEGFNITQDNHVIIRMRQQIPIKEDGKYYGLSTLPIQGKDAKVKHVLNPYAFESVGIVVNSNSDKYKKGEWVQVINRAIAPSRSAEGLPTLPNIFTTYDAYRSDDIMKHYGYIIIPESFIIGKYDKIRD